VNIDIDIHFIVPGGKFVLDTVHSLAFTETAQKTIHNISFFSYTFK